VKLNLGSGEDIKPDYVNADIRHMADLDVLCDMHNLPFQDESFSEVLLIDVIEHSSEPVIVLKEIYRVLEKSGELWLRCPDLEKIIDRDFIESTPFWRTENRLLGGRKNKYDQHKSLFTKEILEKRLREAGFEEIKIKQFRTRPIHWHLGARAKKT